MIRVLCQDLELYQWCTWFGEGRTSLDDEPKSGRPKTSTNEENTSRVGELIKCDRRMKMRKAALKLKIPKSMVHEIVNDTGISEGVCKMGSKNVNGGSQASKG
ncbi:histone-lysine n-methyltransferase setmar-like protein [Elysia marginata]|uniref:Histone-lysine n-methyltransferase setmar-like protein n=1 Tax=Elysia marginata TaxID=1093978 RepID=A0AAV4FLI1_9GAST|nr:histone-lysine n-methyltransferase setmar-like protein [Elysia marginata]